MKKEELKLEVLMSAMHQKDFFVAEKTRIKGNLLIINQCDKDFCEDRQTEHGLWRMISTTERGLSKSRNMAMDNATGDIVLFCDDDEFLVEGYDSIILNAYKQVPNADAIVFNVNRINNLMKKRYYKITKVRKAPFYRGYGSVMLTFRLDSVRKKNIKMCEKFGAGTPWGGGEDSLFEDDIRKCGLNMYEYPATIATIDYANGSTWIDGHNERYFYNIGGFGEYKFKKNFVLKFLRRFYTAVRLRKDKTLSFKEKMRWMYLGGKGFLQDITYKEFMGKNNEETSSR